MDTKIFQCSDDDFMVQSDDEGEVVQVAKMYPRDKHGMEESEEEIKTQITEAERA